MPTASHDVLRPLSPNSSSVSTNMVAVERLTDITKDKLGEKRTCDLTTCDESRMKVPRISSEVELLSSDINTKYPADSHSVAPPIDPPTTAVLTTKLEAATSTEIEISSLITTSTAPSLEALTDCSPVCLKPIPLAEFNVHSAACQKVEREENNKQEREEDRTRATSEELSRAETATDVSYSSPTVKRAVSIEQCPKCLNLFPVVDLPGHSDACISEHTLGDHSLVEELDTRIVETKDEIGSDLAIVSATYLHTTISTSPLVHTPVSTSSTGMAFTTPVSTASRCPSPDRCPFCLKLFPLMELIDHSVLCKAVMTGEAGDCSVVNFGKEADSRESGKDAERLSSNGDKDSERDCSVTKDEKHGEGATGVGWREYQEWSVCGSQMEMDSGRRYDLEPASPIRSSVQPIGILFEPAERSVTTGSATAHSVIKEAMPAATAGSFVSGGSEELEQCMHCLNDFPVTELVFHVECCVMMDKGKVSVFVKSVELY